MVAEAGVELPSPEEARAHLGCWAIRATEGSWKPARHLWWLANRIMEFLEDPTKRFMAVSMPPGHGKSELLSVLLPPFFLGNNPDGRVIQCSYAESLTLEFSRRSRDLLAQLGPEVFDVEVPGRQSAKSWDVFKFDDGLGRIKRAGYLRAVGRGGSTTGKRMELGICDDLTKDDKEASSATMRAAALQWFLKVFMTRLTATGKALVIQTRWHHDDLIGYLQDRQRRGLDRDGWDIVNLPAIAEENDPMGRLPGEALWPEMFPLAELERIKARDGHTWSALYQGRPTPADGAVYKREHFRYCGVEPDVITKQDGKRAVLRKDLVTFAVADLAVSEKDRADFSAFAVCSVDLDAGDLYFLDVIRRRMDGPEILRTMHSLVGGGSGVRSVCVERTAFHTQLCQVALDQGIPVLFLEPDRDKVGRAQPAVAMFAAGRVHFARGAQWLADAESELLRFPSGKDDVADVVAYAVRVLLDLLRAYRGDGGDPGPQPGQVVLRN